MSGDAVRVALEAAGSAIANRHEEQGCYIGYPCAPSCSCRDDAAAAIAAFLRALPGVLDYAHEQSGPGYASIWRTNGGGLAAALAAAKETPSE